MKRWLSGFTAIIDGLCTVLTAGCWSPHLTGRLLGVKSHLGRAEQGEQS